MSEPIDLDELIAAGEAAEKLAQASQKTAQASQKTAQTYRETIEEIVKSLIDLRKGRDETGEIAALQKRLLAGYKSVAGAAKEINNHLAFQLAEQLRIAEVAGKYLDPLEARIKLEERNLEFWEEAARNWKLSEEEQKKEIQFLEERLKYIDATGEKAGRNLLEERRLTLEKLNMLRLTQKMKEEEINQQLLYAQWQSAQRKNQLSIQEKITASLGMSLRWQESWIGKLYIANKEAGGLAGTFRSVGMAIKDGFSGLNITASLLSKLVQSSVLVGKELDSATSSFSALTGAGDTYDEMIGDVATKNRKFGVDTEEASAAIAALYQQYANFTNTLVSNDARNALVTTTARLTKLGVNASTTADVFVALGTVFGQTVEQSIETTKQLAGAAIDIGIVPSKMLEDFKAASGELSAYGSKAIGVFKELAAMAKASNLEVNDLLQIALKFDTFEDAAGVVGRLNARLGGDLFNTIEMMNADLPGRLKLIRRGFDEIGMSFANLEYFERKDIADRMGISVEQLAKLMNMSTSEFEKHSEVMKESAKSEQQWQEIAEAGRDIMASLTLLVKSFAIGIAPLINAFKWLVNGITEGVSGLGDWFKLILVGIPGVWGVTRSISKMGNVIKLTSGSFKSMLGMLKELLSLKGKDSALGEVVESTTETTGGFTQTVEAVESAKEAVDNAKEMTGDLAKKAVPEVSKPETVSFWDKFAKVPWKNILAASVAILAVGAAMYLLGQGMAAMAGAVESWEDVAAILISMAGFAGILFALTPMLAASSPVLLAIAGVLLAVGAAFLMFGAGIQLASQGMVPMADAASILAAGLVSLAMASIGLLGVATAVGILSATLLTLSVSVWAINVEKLAKVGDAFKNIGSAFANLPSVLDVTARVNVVKSAISAVENIEVDTTKTKAFADVIRTTSTLNEEAVTRVERIVTASQGYVEAQAKIKMPKDDAFVNALQLAMGTTGNKSAATGKTELVLKVNRAELGRIIMDVVDEKFKGTVPVGASSR